MSYEKKLQKFVSALSSLKLDYDRFALWYYRRYDHNEMRRTEITRIQDCWTTAYTVMDPSILPDEMIVGKAYRPLTDGERAELNGYVAKYGKDVLKMQGSTAGFTIDVKLLLSKGIEWIIGEFDKKIATLAGTEKDMAVANREGFSSVIRYAHKVSQYIGGVSIKEADPEQKKLQQTMSKMLWRIPQYKAQNFHEAVQSLHFTAFCLTAIPNGVNVVLEGVDEALAPYLIADIDNGVIDLDTAKYIVGCFFAHANFSAFRDQDLTIILTGDAKNPVTDIFKEVKAVLDMRQPRLK